MGDLWMSVLEATGQPPLQLSALVKKTLFGSGW